MQPRMRQRQATGSAHRAGEIKQIEIKNPRGVALCPDPAKAAVRCGVTPPMPTQHPVRLSLRRPRLGTKAGLKSARAPTHTNRDRADKCTPFVGKR